MASHVNALGSALGEGLSDTIRDSSLPDNVRGMPKNVRDAAHNLIAKSRMDMSSASDRADLSDWARMYGQGEILGTDRREEMGVNHLRRMNLSDDQIADIRNRWADEGLIRAPEQAGQSLTTSLDDDQAVKRLPTQYLSGRRANTALGLQELDGMATGAGSLVRRTEEFIQGNDYLKYGIEGLSFVAAPLGYLANAAIARSPVGQAIEAKLGELHESIANRFADAGWGVQDSVDGGTGVMTVGSLAAGFGATKTIALASGVAGIVRPRVADRVRELDVGTYGAQARLSVGDGMSPDHIPSFAAVRQNVENKLGRPLTPAEATKLRNETNTLMIDTEVHQQVSRTYGGRNTPDQVSRDALDLGAAALRDEAVLRPRLALRGYTQQRIDEAFARLHSANKAKGLY